MQNLNCNLVVESLSEGVIVTDLDGRMLLINCKAREILEPIGVPVLCDLISLFMPVTKELIDRCLESGEPQLGQHIQGRSIKIVVNVTSYKDGEQVIGAVCSFERLDQFEISARQLASSKLLTQQLTTIVDNSSDGIWVCDGQGTVINMNKASESLNGVSAEDTIGKNITELLDQKLFDCSVTLDVMKRKTTVSLHQSIKRTEKHLLSTGTPVFDDNGEISMIICNERDMTHLNLINRELEQTRIVAQKLEDRLAQIDHLDLEKQDIVAHSDKMRRVLLTSYKLSQSGASNILILGESGVGKGMLAKFIHQNSRRSDKPFVQINCAALPETLLEAELFGYEGGAFTGAKQQGKPGLLEMAQGGVLFLDEIGDMPLQVQAKLLKYLDDHIVMRLGGTRSVKIDCMIVAATNVDLKAKAKEKAFREDLYYRLSSFILNIPPLRERPEDVQQMVLYYLKKYNTMFNENKAMSIDVLRWFESLPYEGNIRELQNLIRRYVVMGEDALPNLPTQPSEESSFADSHEEQEGVTDSDSFAVDGDKGLVEQVEAVEQKILNEAYNRFETTRQMADHLGVSQPTIVRKLKKYGLSDKG